MEIPFLEEVFSTFSSLSEDKASEPNEFTMKFWQHYLEVVKYEMMSFFKEFFEDGSFVRRLNATFKRVGACSRLDRFLALEEWEDHFSGLTHFVLS